MSVLGTTDNPSEKDSEAGGKSVDRRAVSPSGKVTEPIEQDKKSSTGDDAVTLTYTVGVKEENSRFQGK